MATKTMNYDLTKPSIDDAYDIEVQNGNMDKIDTALTGHRDKLEEAKTHMDDKTVHVTSTERTNWNAKETTTGAQTKANAARDAAISAAASDATSKANAVQSNLNSHANNSTLHPAKDGTLQTNLNVEMLNGTRVYKSLDELGLTRGSETIDQVFNAMAVNSELYYISSGTAIHPTSGGVVRFYKVDENRMNGLFYRTSTTIPELYHANYSATQTPKWSGWVKMPTADGTLQPNFNAEIHNGWRVYTNANQIGLSDSSTMSEIALAMPDSSKLHASVHTGNNTALGLSFASGTLYIERLTASRIIAHAFSTTGLYYLGSFLTNGTFNGWYKVASEDYAVNVVAVGNNADPNTTLEAYILTNHANAPSTQFWHIRTFFYSTRTVSANRAQVAILYSSGGSSRMMMRRYLGSWTEWEELALQSFVDGSFVRKTREIGSDGDLNKIVESGFYRLGASALNAPNSVGYSQLIVSRGRDTITQILVEHGTTTMWVRSGNPPDVGGSGPWRPWRQVLFSDSPALGGIPTVPKPDDNANNNQIPTTSWVRDRAAEAEANGRNPYLSFKPSSDAPSTYPQGYSVFTVATESDYPLSYAIVETIRIGSNRIIQYIHSTNGARPRTVMYRMQTSTTSDLWTGWSEIATTDLIPAIASQAETEAGTDNTKMMTPFRVRQAIDGINRYGVTEGTSTALTITLTPSITELKAGFEVKVKLHTNTGTNPTLKVNGFGAFPMYAGDGVTRFTGVAGRIYTFIYDGTAFILASGGGWGTGDVVPLDKIAIETGGTLTQLWTETSTATARDVATDSLGNSYVVYSNSSGKTVRKLDASGNEVWANSDVSSAWDINVDRSGNVYVAHNLTLGGKTIRKLNSSGGEVWSKTDIASGRSVVVDQSGNVYCAHDVGSGIKAIRKLNASGVEVWSKTDIADAYDVTVDPSLNVYCAHRLTSGKTVRKLNSSGTEVWVNTDQGLAQSIGVSRTGEVYVGYAPGVGEVSIRKLNASGVEEWTKADVSTCNDIFIDEAGYIYVANNGATGTKRLRKVNSSGTEIWTLTTLPQNPEGISVDSNGIVSVVFAGSHLEISLRRYSQNVLGYKIL